MLDCSHSNFVRPQAERCCLMVASLSGRPKGGELGVATELLCTAAGCARRAVDSAERPTRALGPSQSGEARTRRR